MAQLIKLISNRKYWAGVDRPIYVTQGMVNSRLEARGFRNIVWNDRDVPLPSNVNPKTCHIWTDDWDEWLSAEYFGPSGEGSLPATPAWILHGIEDIGASAPKTPVVVKPESTEDAISGRTVAAIALGLLTAVLLFGRRR